MSAIAGPRMSKPISLNDVSRVPAVALGFWVTKVLATTTAGTTLADFTTPSLGIGYTGGSALPLIPVLSALALWRTTMGSVNSDWISSPKVELFYWL